MDGKAHVIVRGLRLGVRVGSVLAWVEAAVFVCFTVALMGSATAEVNGRGLGMAGLGVAAVLLTPVLFGLVLGAFLVTLPWGLVARAATRIPLAVLCMALLALVLDQAVLRPAAGESVAGPVLASLITLGAVFGAAGSGAVAGAGRRRVPWLEGEEPSFFLFGIPGRRRGGGPSGPVPF